MSHFGGVLPRGLSHPLKEQEYLATHIKDCHHVILPNCGHASMYEQPALFTSLIAGFAGLPQVKFDI